MKCIKRLGALSVSLCMMVTMLPAAFAATAKPTGAITLTIGSPTMSVNGTATTIDSEGSRATLYQGSTMLPLRAVMENMGGTVSWNPSNKQITLKYNGSTVTMTLSSKTAYVNGVKKTMQVAPFTDNGRTYVWLRAIEYFPGVTVSWRDDTRQATVVYPMVGSSTLPTSPLQLKITNTSAVIYKELRLAPSGTENWGANILTAPLYGNSLANVTVNVAKTKYDMQATGYYGNKSYFRNLDFTNAGTVGSMTITSAETCTLILDGIVASGVDRSVNLNLYNATGQPIQSIVYGPTGTGIWSSELLANNYLANSAVANMQLQYASANPYYDFRVTYINGMQQTFYRINLASQWGSQLIRLNANGQVTYTNSTNPGSYGNVSITFKNSSGKTVYDLRMASSNTDAAFRSADNLIDTVKSGGSDSFTFDLMGTSRWYLRAYDKSGDIIAKGSIAFSASDKSKTITLKRSGDFVTGSESSSSSETGLLISNTSKEDIYGIFAVDPDDNWKTSWDYDDFNDEYDDIGELDIGEYDVFDLDLYGSNENKVDLIVFYDDGDRFASRSISFDRDISDIGVVCITDISSDSFSYKIYDDGKNDLNDNEIVFELYNSDSSKTLKSVYVRDAEDGDDEDDRINDFDEDILKNTTLSSGSSLSWVIDYDEWNNDGYYDFLFVFDNGDQYVLDDVDLTDYDYFVQLYGDVDGADTTGE